MAKNDVINQFIESVKAGTEGLYAVTVVELSSGMTLGSYSDGTLDPEIASAYNVEVVKAKFKAIEALGLKEESIDDILITLSNQYHLINCTKSGTHMIYLAADKNRANLAILRNTVKKGMTAIKDSLG